MYNNLKRILFIRTTEKLFHLPKLPSNVAVPPLGLMYLTANIRKEFPDQFETKIIDLKLDKLSFHDVRKIIIDFGPDLIGCSVLSCDDECMHILANMSKQISKDIKFLVGGPHATMYYNEILENENIDLVAIGEGERTICNLLRCFNDSGCLEHVPGIAFKDKSSGRILVTQRPEPIENLDELPFPAWDSVSIYKYSSPDKTSMNTMIAGRRYMGIFTSRGCPYQCIYCHNIFGKSYRKRSPESVFNEIKELYYSYGIDEFHIFDDIFNLELERAKSICDLIINSGIKIKIAFPNGVRGDILDEELVMKLKRAGTYSITFALETASPRLQKLIKKNINIEKLLKIINFCDEQKILTKCYFMLGFPTETIEEVNSTIDFACNSKLQLASFFVVTPQKSTELFSFLNQHYPHIDIDFNQYHYYASNKMYEKEIVMLPLERLQKKAYLKFFLNPFRILKIWLRTPRKIFLIRVLPIFLRRLIS